MVGDPAADGAGMDAEEAGDFGLGVAPADAGHGEAVLEFLCGVLVLMQKCTRDHWRGTRFYLTEACSVEILWVG
jgi:hypothetical protein